MQLHEFTFKLKAHHDISCPGVENEAAECEPVYDVYNSVSIPVRTSDLVPNPYLDRTPMNKCGNSYLKTDVVNSTVRPWTERKKH
jgi:hypothetical protein